MKTRVFNLLIFMLFCIFAYSQDALVLSLPQAQQYSLEHNRKLQNAVLDVKKANAERWASLSTILPQVNGTVDYANMMGYKLKMMGFNIAMPPYSTIGINTSITISSAQIIGIKMHKIASDMSEIVLKQSELQAKNQVKTIYFSILIMNETSELLDSNLSNMKKLFEHTENSVRVGILNQTDADKLAVQIISVENGVNSVKRALEMLYNALRIQLGVGVNTNIELSQKLDEIIDTTITYSLLNSQFSSNGNYNYLLLENSALLSKQKLNMAKWAYAPTLTAFHSYSKKEYFSDEPTMNMTPPNIIGLSMKVPLFSSGNRFSSVRAANFEYKKQQNSLADASEGLLVKHKQLVFNLKAALESFQAQKKNIEVNKRIFENVSLKYAHGMASSLDITNAGTSLINAQNSYVQTLLDMVSAQIALEELIQSEN